MLTQLSQVCKFLLKSKTWVYIQRKMAWSNQRSGSRIWGGGASDWRTRSRIKKGRSTSSEETPEYFGAKSASALSKWMKISCVILG